MTNEQIIFNNSVILMEKGIIGTTGRTFEVENEEGTKKTIQEPEPIHTYGAWKSRGYTVKKGQKAIAKFPIWRHQGAGKRKNRNTGEEEDTAEKMYLTDAFFFSKSQVEPIENRPTEPIRFS